MTQFDTISEHRVFGGTLRLGKHDSAAVNGSMALSVFVPDRVKAAAPVLYWLSGLTCTPANFTEKAGAYRKASELGMILVACDTSPRGTSIPDDPAVDLGHGAGFYLDATQSPWKAHFQMETYVTRDLIAVVEANFPADPLRRGISGHSMGGHGALTIAMNHAHLFHSVSAFAPIACAMRAPWGIKALTAYLGSDHSAWEHYDAAMRLAAGAGKAFDGILIDQGRADPYIDSQLMPQFLEQAAQTSSTPLTLRYHDGFDHSYYFIQSFIDDHLLFHAEKLGTKTRSRHVAA